MTTHPNGAGAPPAPAAARTVAIGDRTVVLERLTGLKLSRALAIVRAAGTAVPKIVSTYGTFRQQYEREHSIELDRATARLRFGDELAHMTEEDWQASDNKLRLPASPTQAETFAALLPEVLDLAEEHVYRLLALLTIPNRELGRAWRDGSHVELLDRAVGDLLADSYADELLELAVVAGETIEAQFTAKARELGGRMGNALRLFGLDPATLRAPATPESPQTAPETTQTPSSTSPASTTSDTSTSTTSPASSRPTSSTASESSTDGRPTSPSELPPTSSPASPDELDETPSSEPRPKLEPPAEVAPA